MAVISQYPQVNSFIYLWLKQVKEPFTIWLFNIAVENLLFQWSLENHLFLWAMASIAMESQGLG